MSLPQLFVEKGLELADGALIFGVPFASLTHDELLAAAVLGWDAHARVLDDAYRCAREALL